MKVLIAPLHLLILVSLFIFFNNLSIDAPSFFKNNDRIDEGDTVLVYVSYGNMHPVIVKRGMTLAMKYGALRHEFLIGKQ